MSDALEISSVQFTPLRSAVFTTMALCQRSTATQGISNVNVTELYQQKVC